MIIHGEARPQPLVSRDLERSKLAKVAGKELVSLSSGVRFFTSLNASYPLRLGQALFCLFCDMLRKTVGASLAEQPVGRQGAFILKATEYGKKGGGGGKGQKLRIKNLVTTFPEHVFLKDISQAPASKHKQINKKQKQNETNKTIQLYTDHLYCELTNEMANAFPQTDSHKVYPKMPIFLFLMGWVLDQDRSTENQNYSDTLLEISHDDHRHCLDSPP